MQQDRRQFLQALAGVTAGLAVGDFGFGADAAARDRFGDLLPLRQLGRTGEKVTLLGLGGWHIGRMDEKQAQQTIETAMEGGIRFFDTAEAYYGGRSEERYGRHLVPKYRDAAFIMTKTQARDAAQARQDLEGSLRRLNVDTIDLWQMHALQSESDAEQRVENGVLEVLRQAQKEGKVRYIGFTGHNRFQSHVRMLELWPDAQTVQMPINAVDPGNKSYIDNVLPKALEQNVAPIAMKTLANGGFFGGRSHGSNEGPGKAVIPDVISLEQAMRFVWSLPVSVALVGPDDPAMLQEKIDMVKGFKTMSKAERQQLVAQVNEAMIGEGVEYYKA
jgi:aryl-alcohol dehydrogenase-like predicted oxidoreductase